MSFSPTLQPSLFPSTSSPSQSSLPPSLAPTSLSPSSLPPSLLPSLTKPPSSDARITLYPSPVPSNGSLAPSSSPGSVVVSSSGMPVEIIVLTVVAAFIVLACVGFLCYRKLCRRKAVTTISAGSGVEKGSERESRFNILSRTRTASSPTTGSLSHEYEEYHVTTPPTRKLRSLSMGHRPRLSERKSGDGSLPSVAASLPLPVPPAPPRDRGSFIVPPPTLLEIAPDSTVGRPLVAGVFASFRPRGATDPTRGIRAPNLLLLTGASSNPVESPSRRIRSKTGAPKPPPLPDPEPDPPPPAPSRKPTSAPVPLPTDFGEDGTPSIEVIVDKRSVSSVEPSSPVLYVSSDVAPQLSNIVVEPMSSSNNMPSLNKPKSTDSSSLYVTKSTFASNPSVFGEISLVPSTDSSPANLHQEISDSVPLPFIDLSLAPSQLSSHSSSDSPAPPSPHSISFLSVTEPALRDSPPLRDPPPPPIPIPRPPRLTTAHLRASSREPPSPSSQNEGVKSRVRAFEARSSLSEQPRIRSVGPPGAPSPRVSPPPRTRANTGQTPHSQPISPRSRTLSSNVTSSDNPWIQRANKQGKIYYLNINTGESVWENPDLLSPS